MRKALNTHANPTSESCTSIPFCFRAKQEEGGPGCKANVGERLQLFIYE